jgi:hypothetical protein
MKTCLQLNTSHGTKLPTSLSCTVLTTWIHWILHPIPFRSKCCFTRSRWIKSVKRCSFLSYNVFEHKIFSYKKYLPPAKLTRHKHYDLRTADTLLHTTHGSTDYLVSQISRITGSWSMENRTLQHGIERQVTFYFAYNFISFGILCLELPIIYSV